MSPRLWLVLAALLFAPPASAYDPRGTWSTLEAGQCRVHYPEGRYAQALHVARAAAAVLAELQERLGWRPQGHIEIVLNDEVDVANGYALAFPYNLITLNLAPPDELSELSAYDDWLYLLTAHELTHIIHIDTVRGLPATLNGIFGRRFFPNGAQPRWLTEGLATYFESQLTSRGRVRSSFFDMMLRTAVLEDTVFGLDDVSGAPRDWPQGATAYLYGSELVAYLARRFGEDTLRQVSYDYGGRLIPWAVNLSIRRATGHDYETLYDDFLVDLAGRVADDHDAIVRQGLLVGEPLTRRGQNVGPARAAKDGTLYFVENPKGSYPAVRRLQQDGTDEEVTRIGAGARLALFPDGKRALVSQAEVYEDYASHNDLFVLDLESGAEERLTVAARASLPDVAADGEHLAFVQLAGAHTVVRLTTLSDMGAVRTLADLGPGSQVWAPRFSPDGSKIAFAGFVDGRRDLYLVTREGELTRLTDDAALDGAPAFSPDGAWLYFHSDRDGVFNIYALPLAAPQQVRRVTRVLTGAFRPEPTADGRLVYQGYGAHGYDLYALARRPPEELPLAEPSKLQTRPPPPQDRLEVFPTHAYDGSETIRPHAWLPGIGYDARGFYVGAAINGKDALEQHTYTLSANYESREPFVSFAAAYTNKEFHPGLSFVGARTLGYAAFPYVRNGVPVAVQEEVWTASLSTLWPLLTRREYVLGVVTAYELEVRQGRTDLTLHPLDQQPLFPDTGRFAAARVGLSFGKLDRYVDSISAENGGTAFLALRLEDPYLGSEYSSLSATLSLDGYLSNPWLDRHVLHGRAFLGYGDASYRTRRLYGIGGLVTRDVLLDTLRARFFSAPALRGFPAAPFVGDIIAQGTLEYRLPLLDIDAGASTLPMYVRTLHAAAFSDGALVADALGLLGRFPHVSVGGELRLGLFMGYATPFTLRLGYGRGLASDRVQTMFAVLDADF